MMNERRIADLDALFRNAVIVDDLPSSKGAVGLGSTVTIDFDGEEEQYTIVGAIEAKPIGRQDFERIPNWRRIAGQATGSDCQCADSGRITDGEDPAGGVGAVRAHGVDLVEFRNESGTGRHWRPVRGARCLRWIVITRDGTLDGSLEGVGLVGLLPGEIEVGTTEVAVGRGLADRSGGADRGCR